jgi:hypothetical protein
VRNHRRSRPKRRQIVAHEETARDHKTLVGYRRSGDPWADNFVDYLRLDARGLCNRSVSVIRNQRALSSHKMNKKKINKIKKEQSKIKEKHVK